MQLKQQSLEQCGQRRASLSFSMQMKQRNTSAMLCTETEERWLGSVWHYSRKNHHHLHTVYTVTTFSTLPLMNYKQMLKLLIPFQSLIPLDKFKLFILLLVLTPFDFSLLRSGPSCKSDLESVAPNLITVIIKTDKIMYTAFIKTIVFCHCGWVLAIYNF